MPWRPQTDYLQYIALVARRLLRLSVSLSTCLSVCCLSHGRSVCLCLFLDLRDSVLVSVTFKVSLSACLPRSCPTLPLSLSIPSPCLCMSQCLCLSVSVCVSVSLSVNLCFSLSLSLFQSQSQSPRQCPCLSDRCSFSVVSLSLCGLSYTLSVSFYLQSLNLSVRLSLCRSVSVSPSPRQCPCQPDRCSVFLAVMPLFFS